MLKVTVKGQEHFNEATRQFSTVGDVDLYLEHSLVSLSKWESIHQVPFLSSDEKTGGQLLDYVNCMSVNGSIPVEVLYRLTPENIKEINDYIESAQSATTFRNLPEQKGRRRADIITSELIYYWMVSYQIPFECENWHLNRLFALIKICGVKNSKPKKRSMRDIAAQQRELNAQRRAQFGTRG